MAVILLPFFSLKLVAAPVPTNKPSTYPAWWFSRGAIVPLNPSNPTPNWPADYPTSDDYAVINQGQLKNFATQAYAELQAKAPAYVWSSSQGTALSSLVTGWSPSSGDAYAAINLGQLKTVAKPFYDVLIELGYPTIYPWTGVSADDYAAANIGQAKNTFSFDLGFDTDGNGLPDWWETEYFGALGNAASSSPDGNGLTLLQDYQQGNDPTNYYSQNGSIITPTFTVFSGNNQTGTSGQFLASPLVVKVTNSSGTVMANAPVSFWVASGNGQLSGVVTGSASGSTFQTTTNSSGLAQVYFQQPLVANFTSTISAATAGIQVNFAETTSADNSSPAAPSNGEASPGLAAGEIDLTWTNNADNATYLVIQQSTDNINWSTIKTLTDPTATFYAVTGLPTGQFQTYYYRIAAGN